MAETDPEMPVNADAAVPGVETDDDIQDAIDEWEDLIASMGDEPEPTLIEQLEATIKILKVVKDRI